jgi:anti-sigma factor RsiW
MACEAWKLKLDTYLDGELPSEQMRAFDAHVHGCRDCAADALSRVQIKRHIHAVGKRFTPTLKFRERVQKRIAGKPGRPSVWWAWGMASAVSAVLVVIGLAAADRGRAHARSEQIYGEVADLHVATLASATPVDVISSDRHTVKPWFQGKIPFAFDLPELQNSGFSLLGGRMTYLDQTPGAHLIYEARKHRISVFVFQERSLQSGLDQNSPVTRKLSFNVETWTQGGLRYFVVGDASAADIHDLAKLFKADS